MSTNDDLTAKSPELRKRFISVGSLLLLALGMIAATSTRRKNDREKGLLFRRSLLNKGGIDTPPASPTDAPSSFPSSPPSMSAQPSGTPSSGKKCFETTDELYGAVDKFLENDEARKEELRQDYGLPIGTWCVSDIQDFSELFDRFRNPLASTFNEDISEWDTSKGTTMQYMFYGTKAFNQPLSSWNTSNVVNFVSNDQSE
jgi:surface protein